MNAKPSLVRNAGEGEQRWFAGGGVLTMKATTDETAGAISVFEDSVVRGKTTPLHVHPHNDEMIYVLDGEMLVHLGGVEHVVRTGGMYFVPRGTSHAFLVTSETARLLFIQTPGDSEAFYRDNSDPASSEADRARPADFVRVREGAAKSPHIELLGPPPFVR